MEGADLCIRSLKQAGNDYKGLLTQKCQYFLEAAEKIKRDPEWQPPERASPLQSSVSLPIRQLHEPSSSRSRSTAEKIILLKASKLNGFTFLEWEKPPDPRQFEVRPGQSAFIDSPELGLSDLQLEVFKGWQRASEALPPPAWSSKEPQRKEPVMIADSETDLVQDATTDCSVVASLCADLARTHRGHAKIIPSRIWPYDTVSGVPQISPSGKYVVRLNFNGCYRSVEIDDRLPVSATPRTMHVVDRHNPALLWPALIEKAYLKVWGGYDFPGSNSGTDLWILTGWIPQQIFLHDNESPLSTLWKRMYKGFINGDVLITMGTGQMSDQVEHEIGLAGQHDYAVLDLQEKDNQCLLLLKNPWYEGTCWKGTISEPPKPDGSPVSGLVDGLVVGSNDSLSVDPKPETPSSLTTNSALQPGTFWIDLQSVMQHFESIYLNWNPGLFSHRQDIHFSWDLGTNGSGDERVGRCVVSNPQFVVTSAKGQDVWLLLSKHLRGKRERSDSRKRPPGLQEDREEFISLYAFENGGKRVYLNTGSFKRGPLVDSPQTLLCLKVAPGIAYTVVCCEQNLKYTIYTFTLATFSSAPVTLVEAPSLYSHQSTIQGSWTRSSAGGSTNSPSYIRNPQFSLTLTQKTPLAILLSCSLKQVHVQVRLVHGGQRIRSLPARRDVIVDSAEYRKESALATLPSELPVGVYTVICSTFESGQVGDFVLRVDSMAQISIRRLPGEDAGRLRTKLTDAVFGQGSTRIAARITPKRLTRLALTVQRSGTLSNSQQAVYGGSQQHDLTTKAPKSHSLLQLTIEVGRGPMKKVLFASSNGQHADTADGVHTEDIDLWPEAMSHEGLWLVLDRMSANAAEEQFHVEMFSDTVDGVSFGSWQAWDD
ncbi:MAG: cysteine protease [Bathelium mastoideum]|nr:MAG: cysteine protease [Bathelium mastoideum]